MRDLSQHHSTEVSGTALERGEVLGFFVFSFLFVFWGVWGVGFFCCVLVGVFCWFGFGWVGLGWLVWGFLGFFVKPSYYVLFFLKLYLNLKLWWVEDSIVCYILKQKVQITKLVVSASRLLRNLVIRSLKLFSIWRGVRCKYSCEYYVNILFLIQCALNL